MFVFNEKQEPNAGKSRAFTNTIAIQAYLKTCISINPMNMHQSPSLSEQVKAPLSLSD